MVDAGLRCVAPSHLCPLMFGFLCDNQLSEVAMKFAKVTGATQQDANASSFLRIYSFWLKSAKAPKQKLQANGPVNKKAKKKASSCDRSEDSHKEEEAQGPAAKKAAVPAAGANLPQHLGKAVSKQQRAAAVKNLVTMRRRRRQKEKARPDGITPQAKIAKAAPKKAKNSDSDSDSSSEDGAPENQKAKRTPVAAKLRLKPRQVLQLQQRRMQPRAKPQQQEEGAAANLRKTVPKRQVTAKVPSSSSKDSSNEKEEEQNLKTNIFLQFSPLISCSSTKEVSGNPDSQENCGEETVCGKQEAFPKQQPNYLQQKESSRDLRRQLRPHSSEDSRAPSKPASATKNSSNKPAATTKSPAAKPAKLPSKPQSVARSF
ncbi:Nucleolar and coiled-body phosphoprotein 1 [Plecturocebus cupreus]